MSQSMALFDRLFGSRKDDDDHDQPVEFPWDRSPSIYEHLQAHIRSGETGLCDGGATLPDEDRLAGGSQIRWAAGAMDGVLTHHMGGSDDDNVTALLDLVRAYWNTPTAKNKAAVYEFVVENGIVGLIDPFIEQLTQQEDVNHNRLYDLVQSYAKDAPDREPVKFGIAILGLYDEPRDAEIFRTLGRHDEFTLFCAVALSSAGDAEGELWRLAKSVDGWGRIQIVERLAETENADIKDWMLREGYKNSIMYEYLAYTCAMTGGLLGALSQDSVDDELLIAAGEIIQALISGGPAEGMDNYDDGAVVVELYLDQIAQRGTTLPQFLTAASIKNFLAGEEADWNERAERGWIAEKRSAMREQCEAIISNPAWRERVMEGLQSGDEKTFFSANQAAQVLGIETWEFHWNRLRRFPLDSGRWFHVMTSCNDERIDDVLDFAGQHLPLDEIATGPATEMGLGPGWEPHGCLDFILQELGRFPGKGVPLVEAGLRSPVIRNRNVALKVLSEWGDENCPGTSRELLLRALEDEPDEDARERIRKVIFGEELD